MDVELSVDLQSHLLDRPHFVAVIRLGGAAIRKLDGERKEKQERSQASQLPHSC